MATIINEIDPITFEIQTYTPKDLVSIPSETIHSAWGNDSSKGEYAECTISSPDRSFQLTDQNYAEALGSNFVSSDGVAYNVDIDPERVLRNKGFNGGEYNIIFRFLKNELSSSSDTRPYLIKEISTDRTEIRIVSNFINNDDLIKLVTDFKNRPNKDYFQDFYLNFGSNNLVIANNILVDNTKTKYDLLINLYEPLPPQIQLREPLWIVTQPADPLAFNVQFQPEIVTPKIFAPTLKTANFNIPIKDKTNNSSQPISFEQLFTSSLVSSYQQINSYLAEKSINISIDYSNFENFIHFSSAESRVRNFYYKVQLIEKYENDVITLEGTPTTPLVESNILYLNNKIDDLIKNFDGFEYFLYFSSGSISYPKKSTPPPYVLIESGDDTVLNWYNGLIDSASFYDENNKDYLINTIPDYLREDPQNDPYKVFVDMMGQHYDNIWIYYKDVSNRYNGDNRLEYGISKDLVADAIKSFGLNVYQNNFSSTDLFNAFIGYNPDNGLRTTNPTDFKDKEIINTYEYISQETLNIPLDDVNKEMYKRIYHNLPYLLKSKGTVAGLQNIISMFGIPNTVLTIKEFGGVYSLSYSPDIAPYPGGAQLVTGIRDIIPDNIEIISGTKFSSSMVPIVTLDGDNTYKPMVLSPVKSIFQEPWYDYSTKKSLSPSINTIEIGFSPQNDVDNYIKDNFLSFFESDIGSLISIPLADFNNYGVYYSNLLNVSNTLLSNHKYNLSNYLHLIKYFDNSLFLMIKDFIPAKTNLKSGIIIKPHLLNRSKHDAPRAYIDSSSYVGTVFKSSKTIGSTGGTFNEFNTLTHPSNSQFWYEQIPTPLGYTSSYHIDQSEFYNGELPNSSFIAITGESNPQNISKYPGTDMVKYNVQVQFGDSASFINGGFPGNGIIQIWYDQGSVFNAPNAVLGPNSFTGFGGAIAGPSSLPNGDLPELPVTNDRNGSSGGGSGGSLGAGGTGNVLPTER